MTAVLDVATAVDSIDCTWPNCDREAERDGRCRYHAGRLEVPREGGEPRPYTDEAGRVIPGALAHLMDDEPEPKETQMADLVLCRVDGCTRASVAQKGPWKGWCAEHKLEEMKRRSSVRRDRTPADPVKPPPVEKPATNGNGNPAARLAELLPLIVEKREELLELQAEAVGLVTDINELIEAA